MCSVGWGSRNSTRESAAAVPKSVKLTKMKSRRTLVVPQKLLNVFYQIVHRILPKRVTPMYCLTRRLGMRQFSIISLASTLLGMDIKDLDQVLTLVERIPIASTSHPCLRLVSSRPL